MAGVMEGVITIVQEGRFQLTDTEGVGHMFVLGHSAAADTAQLPGLQRNQSRVRVHFSEPSNIIGNVATRIARLG